MGSELLCSSLFKDERKIKFDVDFVRYKYAARGERGVPGKTEFLTRDNRVSFKTSAEKTKWIARYTIEINFKFNRLSSFLDSQITFQSDNTIFVSYASRHESHFWKFFNFKEVSRF